MEWDIDLWQSRRRGRLPLRPNICPLQRVGDRAFTTTRIGTLQTGAPDMKNRDIGRLGSVCSILAVIYPTAAFVLRLLEPHAVYPVQRRLGCQDCRRSSYLAWPLPQLTAYCGRQRSSYSTGSSGRVAGLGGPASGMRCESTTAYGGAPLLRSLQGRGSSGDRVRQSV